MLKVRLLCMPYAQINMPSLALTQLQSVVRAKWGSSVSVDVIYLNHDFAQFLGHELNTYIADSFESLLAGLGEWLFRQVAFPDVPDNDETYFSRYRRVFADKIGAYQGHVLKKRAQ